MKYTDISRTFYGYFAARLQLIHFIDILSFSSVIAFIRIFLFGHLHVQLQKD